MGNKNGTGNKGKSGQIPWNKGIKTGIAPWRGKKRPDIAEKLKLRWKNGKNPIQNRVITKKLREKLSNSKKGKLNGFWKGGITPLSMSIRKMQVYKDWQKKVLEIDDYRCHWCGSSKNLQVDHIWSFSNLLSKYQITCLEDAEICDDLWNLDNGRVLCVECHKKTVTYGNKKDRNPYLSMVIPTYTQNKDLEELAYTAACSYRKFVDELIIIEDGQMYSPRLQKIANTYIYVRKNKGFTKTVNFGWKLAKGEYVAIVNSDTFLLKGNLRDLCIEGKVTSPLIANQYIDRLAGPFWCAPREVTKKYGYLMEEMVMYSSDSEYDERVKDIFQKVQSVKIFHEMAQSVKAAGVEGGVTQQRDREIYAKLRQEGRAK